MPKTSLLATRRCLADIIDPRHLPPHHFGGLWAERKLSENVKVVTILWPTTLELAEVGDLSCHLTNFYITEYVRALV